MSSARAARMGSAGAGHAAAPGGLSGAVVTRAAYRQADGVACPAMRAWDDNGWASGLVEPLPSDQSYALLAPEPASRIDEARWAHLARTSVRAVLELSPAKRYPSATMPLVDVVRVRIRHLDRLEEGPAAREVEVVTVPLERAPAVRALARRGAAAIGGA